MTLGKKPEAAVRAQFGRPTGLCGRAAGLVMAHRSANRRRNARAVSLLDVRPDDRVLESGFGPGLAIRELACLATQGYVCGIDHSELMLRRAIRLNAEGVGRGVVDLRLGSVEGLPALTNRSTRSLPSTRRCSGASRSYVWWSSAPCSGPVA